MKKMKKLISAVLSIAMVAGLFGGTALNAQAYMEDIVSDNGWSINVDFESLKTLLDGKTDTAIFYDSYEQAYINFTTDTQVIQQYLTITGLDMDCVETTFIGFNVYDELEDAYIYCPASIDENSIISVGIQIETNEDKLFYDVSAKSTFLKSPLANI